MILLKLFVLHCFQSFNESELLNLKLPFCIYSTFFSSLTSSFLEKFSPKEWTATVAWSNQLQKSKGNLHRYTVELVMGFQVQKKIQIFFKWINASLIQNFKPYEDFFKEKKTFSWNWIFLRLDFPEIRFQICLAN